MSNKIDRKIDKYLYEDNLNEGVIKNIKKSVIKKTLHGMVKTVMATTLASSKLAPFLISKKDKEILKRAIKENEKLLIDGINKWVDSM